MTTTDQTIDQLPAALRELLAQAQRERLDRQLRDAELAAQAPARAATHWSALLDAADAELGADLAPYWCRTQPPVWRDGVQLHRLEIHLPGLAAIGVVFGFGKARRWVWEPGYHVFVGGRHGRDVVFATLKEALLSALDVMTEESLPF